VAPDGGALHGDGVVREAGHVAAVGAHEVGVLSMGRAGVARELEAPHAVAELGAHEHKILRIATDELHSGIELAIVIGEVIELARRSARPTLAIS
jgi:hypothetical protein